MSIERVTVNITLTFLMPSKNDANNLMVEYESLEPEDFVNVNQKHQPESLVIKCDSTSVNIEQPPTKHIIYPHDEEG